MAAIRLGTQTVQEPCDRQLVGYVNDAEYEAVRKLLMDGHYGQSASRLIRSAIQMLLRAHETASYPELPKDSTSEIK